MGFSSGGYQFELAAQAAKSTRGKSNADTYVYVGTNGGSIDPADAADALLYYYRTNHQT